MREIKFRALEKPSDMVLEMGYKPKMVYGTGIFEDGINTWLAQHEKGYPMASGVFGEIGDTSHGQRYIVDPNTVGQFTGLHDKHGKDIYEGDIIKSGEFICQIIWNKVFASFCLARNGWLNDHWFGEADDPENVEVIGNIYENLELLEIK